MNNVRESETIDEKDKRNATDRDNKKNSRETETVVEKDKRNTANRDNMKNAREAETAEEKDNRNTANRDNMKKMRNTESDNKKKNTLLSATSSDVDPFSVGLMNQVCSCCSSLMFAEETHRGKLGVNGEPGTASFSMCCR